MSEVSLVFCFAHIINSDSMYILTVQRQQCEECLSVCLMFQSTSNLIYTRITRNIFSFFVYSFHSVVVESQNYQRIVVGIY